MSKINELSDYHRFTDKQETDKAFHVLEGMLKGIDIDSKINQIEIEKLKKWCADYYDFISKPPFNEAIPFILGITEDNIITPEEYKDLEWLCQNIITPNKYYDAVTSDIQRLHGILHGVLSDGVVTKEELDGILAWINAHPELMGSYPYDEIEGLIYTVLNDNKITDEEQNLLKVYFSQFVDVRNTALTDKELEDLRKTIQIPVICAMDADVTFKNKLFCFTGISSKGQRKTIVEKIVSLGGIYNDAVIKETDYLIIGDKNNPCWAFSCYGRKVEKAIENRKQGRPIQIIKEIDFWDGTFAFE